MIPLKVRKQIIAELARSELSQRKIGRKFGVHRGTVNSIAKSLRSPTIPSPGLIRFHAVAEYWCDNCQAMVTTRPCVACVARGIGGKSS
jgi:hypothetical protein